MELIGTVNERKIFYVQIRNNTGWKSLLPKGDWVAFTIADKEDQELVPSAVKVCLDTNVSYMYSTGTLAYWKERPKVSKRDFWSIILLVWAFSQYS